MAVLQTPALPHAVSLWDEVGRGSPAPGKGFLQAPTLLGYSSNLGQPIQTPSSPPSQALFSMRSTLPLQTNVSLAQ